MEAEWVPPTQDVSLQASMPMSTQSILERSETGHRTGPPISEETINRKAKGWRTGDRYAIQIFTNLWKNTQNKIFMSRAGFYRFHLN